MNWGSSTQTPPATKFGWEPSLQVPGLRSLLVQDRAAEPVPQGRLHPAAGGCKAVQVPPHHPQGRPGPRAPLRKPLLWVHGGSASLCPIRLSIPPSLRPSARTRRVELPPGSFLPADRPSGPALRSPSLPPAVPPSLLELPACVREPGSRASLSPGAAQSHLLHILFFSRLLLCFSTCSYVCHAWDLFFPLSNKSCNFCICQESQRGEMWNANEESSADCVPLVLRKDPSRSEEEGWKISPTISS